MGCVGLHGCPGSEKKPLNLRQKGIKEKKRIKLKYKKGFLMTGQEKKIVSF